MARGLLAVVALVGLVVVPPVVLAKVAGWPLPTSVPTADQLSRGLGAGGLSDALVVKAIALVGWLLWIQVLAGLALEVAAALRHRQAPRSRLVGPTQLLLRRLVATATFLVGTGLPAVAGGGGFAPPPAVVSAWSPPPEPAPPPAPAPPEVESQPTYVVRGGDSLRAIAARHLGSEERWQEIFEANRHVPQDRGRLEVPSLIRPGWVLRMPADATGLGPSDGTAPAAKRYRVVAGDNLAAIAARHLGDPRRGWDIWSLNKAAVMADGQRFVDPDLVRPGWILELPPDAHDLPDEGGGIDGPADGEPVSASAPPEPAPPPANPAPSPPTAPATAVSGNGAGDATARPAPAQPPSSRAPEDGGAPGPDAVLPVRVPAAVIAASGLVAACVVAALDRLRRHQHRLRRPGRGVARPEPDLAPAEAQWRAIAADEAAEWIDGTLRLLGVALAGRDATGLPEVLLVRAGELGVELLLARPLPDAPEGFDAAEDGRIWRLDRTITLAELGRRSEGKVPLAPGLVTLGATPEGQVLVDLERIGTLSVEGARDRVAAFCTGAALQLATGPWTETTQVRLVGGPPQLGDAFAEEVEATADAEALADELEELSAKNQERHGAVSTLAARVAAGGAEGYAPLVVVAWSDTAAPDVLARLSVAAGAGGRSGIGLVAAGPVTGARWRLVIDASGAAVVEPLGMALAAVGAEPDLVEAAPALLAAAADTRGVAMADSPGDAARPKATDVLSPRGSGKEIRILGPEIEVVGWEHRPNRRIVTELAAYLATREDGRPRSADELRAALWPLGADLLGKEVSEETFRSYVSHLRRCLGRDHVPDAGEVGGYLVVGVPTDWRRFKALVAQARRAPTGEARTLLAEALSLVRGRPFSRVPKGTCTWAFSEFLVSEIEVAVGDAAHRLASLALDAGDPATAAEAVAKGLLVVPTMEQLHQDRMLAAAMARDRGALHRARRDAEHSLGALGPTEELSEEILALYHQLLETLSRPVDEAPGGMTGAVPMRAVNGNGGTGVGAGAGKRD
ncbi:MAG: LysM peptidoglycan-binding domain-containing protein [Actinobacteria bacterium]|nr:LysM peptidoglycan-binding domain-containing protein [Actinomycetota bacterium]